jgi:hypothetical protein
MTVWYQVLYIVAKLILFKKSSSFYSVRSSQVMCSQMEMKMKISVRIRRILCSHSNGYEEYYLLGYQPTFRKNIAPPSSGLKNMICTSKLLIAFQWTAFQKIVLFSQNSWCASWDLHWSCSKYKSEVLLLEPAYFMISICMQDQQMALSTVLQWTLSKVILLLHFNFIYMYIYCNILLDFIGKSRALLYEYKLLYCYLPLLYPVFLSSPVCYQMMSWGQCLTPSPQIRCSNSQLYIENKHSTLKQETIHSFVTFEMTYICEVC